MIFQKAQNSIRDYLAGLTFTTFTPEAIVSGIFAERNAYDKVTPLPSITVQCADAQMDGHESAHYIAQVEVRLQCNADDTTEDAFLDRCEELEGFLVADGLDAEISGSTFTAQLVEWTGTNYELDGRSWVWTVRGNVHCVGRELT